MNYQPKDVKFDDEAREKLISGIEKIYKAVSSTLGPRGNTVLMESMVHTGGMTSTKDGVTVANAIDLADPIENLAVRVMRQAADKTAAMAGDGTTTSIVLTRELIRSAIGKLKDNNKLNPNILVRELKNVSDMVLEEMKKKARPVGKRNLRHVATISANNDKDLGAMIAETYKKVGKNGVVSVKKSETSETYTEVTSGIKLDKGMVSDAFRNNEGSDRCVLERPLMIVSTIEISSFAQVQNAFEQCATENRSLVIIAPTTKLFKNMVAANVVKGNIKACIIEPPSFGYRQKELMRDIALVTGATYFSEEEADDLSLLVENDLGTCDSVDASTKDAIIITSKNSSNDELVKARVDELSNALSKATKQSEKNHIQSRIAALDGAIGVIYAGGETDMEQKELYDRIDDAIQAVKSAMDEGVVVGGGYALYHSSTIPIDGIVDSMINGGQYIDNAERAAACYILSDAMTAPAIKILENAGAVEFISENSTTKVRSIKIGAGTGDHGINAMTMSKVDDLIKDGVIDPFKVVKVALTNAVSVASTILTTNAVLTLARSYDYE